MKAAALSVCLLFSCNAGARPQPSAASEQRPAAAAVDSLRAERPSQPAPKGLQAAPSSARVERAARPRYRSPSADALRVELTVPGLGQWLSAQPDREAAIDLPNAARVHLAPGTSLVVLDFEPSAFALVTGAVFVEMLPQGEQQGRTPLRVVSALGTVIAANSAEVWLSQARWQKPGAANDSGVEPMRAALILLRGSAELAQRGPDGSTVSQILGAGRVLPGEKPRDHALVPPTLDAARRIGAEILRRQRTALRVAGPVDELEHALAASAEQRRQGAALLSGLLAQRANAQGAPASHADVAAVRRAQRELAVHAQRRHTLRQQVQLAAERNVLTELLACDDLGSSVPNACPALGVWAERYARRVQGQAD